VSAGYRCTGALGRVVPGKASILRYAQPITITVYVTVNTRKMTKLFGEFDYKKRWNDGRSTQGEITHLPEKNELLMRCAPTRNHSSDQAWNQRSGILYKAVHTRGVEYCVYIYTASYVDNAA